MAGPAPRLVALLSPDHDGRGVVSGGTAIDQPLVAAGQVAADDTDRPQLVHLLGYRHQVAHRTERLAPEIGIYAGEDDTDPPGRERSRHRDDAPVQELRLVDRDQLGIRSHQTKDLGRSVYRRCVELFSIV